MSDLHRAVQAEIAAHTPSLSPSFDALKARKRTRDRRRTAAAVAATVLAVAAVAVAPAALGLGERGRSVPTVAGDGPEASQDSPTVRCAPGDYTDRTGDYAGLTEQQAEDMAAAEGNTARVIRRDGTCQSVDQNLDPSRVSLVVQDGSVVWAGQDRPVVQDYTPPGVEVRVEKPAVAGRPVRIEAVIQDDRDVAVHRVEFGDGTEQVVQFTCADSSPRPAPPGPQTHVVEHTWDAAGEYTLTFHYGPPCQEATSSVAHAVRVDQPTAGPARPAIAGTVTDRDCTGDCAAGFELSGQEYLLSCEAIPLSNLAPEAVAEGTLYDRQVEVWKITAGARLRGRRGRTDG